jgi:hypothetical protein
MPGKRSLQSTRRRIVGSKLRMRLALEDHSVLPLSRPEIWLVRGIGRKGAPWHKSRPCCRRVAEQEKCRVDIDRSAV